MSSIYSRSAIISIIVCFAYTFIPNTSARALAATAENSIQLETPNIWDHDNLIAWEVAASDTKERTPEERARMLKDLGFKRYAYLSSRYPWDAKNDVNDSQKNFDAEIEALQRYDIEILGWFFWLNADDPAKIPKIKATFESFRRHHIHPQVWVTHSYDYLPTTPEEWAKLIPKEIEIPRTTAEFNALSDADQEKVWKEYTRARTRIEAANFPRTPAEQRDRVRREADRISSLVRLAAAYECKVNIYNHRSWFGVIENELAIINRLQEMGVKDVGIVYNFSHSRDAFFDDSKVFPKLWKKVQPYVVAVNVVGLSEDRVVYLSQGDREVEMMRIIQDSGWKGPVGIFIHTVGDTRVMLEKSLTGLDWIAAELHRAGSGGPRPVFSDP